MGCFFDLSFDEATIISGVVNVIIVVSESPFNIPTHISHDKHLQDV